MRKFSITDRGEIYLTLSGITIALTTLLPVPLMTVLPIFLISYIVSFSVLSKDINLNQISASVRVRNTILYRNEPELLVIEVENKSELVVPHISIRIRNPHNAYLIRQSSHHTISLEGREKVKLVIPFVVLNRGETTIGPVSVSVTDGLNLLEINVVEESIPAKVFPARLGKKVVREEALQVFSKMTGLFSTKIKGSGSEFWGLRDYVRGDSSKIVYWPATARLGKLISKEYEQESQLTAYVVTQGGATMRGAKFDYVLGVSMDIYRGIIEQRIPCGFIFFENGINFAYSPSLSKRQEMRLWSLLYAHQLIDEYADYEKAREYFLKHRISNSLIIVIGDTESDINAVSNLIRTLRLNRNDVIFIDIWGYKFSYEQKLNDAIQKFSGVEYGLLLDKVFSKVVENNFVFRGLKLKDDISRMGAVYGYVSSSEENIVQVLKRAMYSHFGARWKMS